MQTILDDSVRFTAGMTTATKAFARAKPWQGTVAERSAKFAAYHAAVSEENDFGLGLRIETETITDKAGASGASQLGYLNTDGRLVLRAIDRQTSDTATIIMRGRLSVVTYLFLVGMALGYKRGAAMKFAVNLFRQRFPRSFAACRFERGLLVR